MIVALLTVATLACASPAHAAKSYASEMPSVQRVLAKVRGSDRSDTLARQRAAFVRLIAMMTEAKGDGEFDPPTAAERRVRANYQQQMGLIEAGVTSERTKWFDRTYRYELDEGFNRKLRGLFLSLEFRAIWAKEHRKKVTPRPTPTAAPGPVDQEEEGQPWWFYVALPFMILFFFIIPGAVIFNGMTWTARHRW
jgi:hypothetical protein